MAEMNLFPRQYRKDASDDAPADMPLGGSRSEAVQRLQVGLFGIGAMILLVGLASIIGGQADLVDQSAVPNAAPTTEPNAAPSQRDPLADAGVIPDIPADPTPSPTATSNVSAVPGRGAADIRPSNEPAQ